MDPEAARIDEILSSSLEGTETVEDPLAEAQLHPPQQELGDSNPKPGEAVARVAGEDADDQPGAAAAPSPVDLPQSPVVPVRFAPACHSSPNVGAAARVQLLAANEGSPTGSIPAIYSPSGSPSGGILKRRDTASPSPSNKVRPALPQPEPCPTSL